MDVTITIAIGLFFTSTSVLGYLLEINEITFCNFSETDFKESVSPTHAHSVFYDVVTVLSSHIINVAVNTELCMRLIIETKEETTLSYSMKMC